MANWVTLFDRDLGENKIIKRLRFDYVKMMKASVFWSRSVVVQQYGIILSTTFCHSYKPPEAIQFSLLSRLSPAVDLPRPHRCPLLTTLGLVIKRLNEALQILPKMSAPIEGYSFPGTCHTHVSNGAFFYRLAWDMVSLKLKSVLGRF